MKAETVVLILGAGSSAQYNFPCGAELIHEICVSFGENCRRLVTCEAGREFMKGARPFVKALEESGALSIDDFLYARPEFSEIGKVAIASALLPKESEAALFDTARISDSWYHHLLKWYRKGGRLSGIITFNYDRSLDHFLIKTAERYLEIEYRKVTDCIPQRIHVYGQLGWLPGQSDPSDEIPFQPDLSEGYADKILKAASAISTIADSGRRLMNFDRCENMLKEADILVFLGFGFHKTNLIRLMLGENLNPEARIVGTVYADLVRKKNSIVNLLHELAPAPCGERIVDLREGTCLDLIRDGNVLA